MRRATQTAPFCFSPRPIISRIQTSFGSAMEIDSPVGRVAVLGDEIGHHLDRLARSARALETNEHEAPVVDDARGPFSSLRPVKVVSPIET